MRETETHLGTRLEVICVVVCQNKINSGFVCPESMREAKT